MLFVSDYGDTAFWLGWRTGPGLKIPPFFFLLDDDDDDDDDHDLETI